MNFKKSIAYGENICYNKFNQKYQFFVMEENMAYDEGRVFRDGVSMPIQCLYMNFCTDPREVVPAPLHYHDYVELLFGTGGRARAVVGEHTYSFGAGDMLYIHTHEPHSIWNESERCSYVVVKFLPEVLLGEEQSYSEYGCALLLMESASERQNLFRAEELAGTPLSSLFTHIMNEWETADFAYELGLRADVMSILLYILRRWREKNPLLMESVQTSGHGGLIQSALRYVREHYPEANEGQAAAFCGITPGYFSRLFKRTMHCGFSEYVKRVRLREAERLLLSGDQSMTEIAEEVGFATTSYFISCFRARYHTTPLRYRTERQKQT